MVRARLFAPEDVALVAPQDAAAPVTSAFGTLSLVGQTLFRLTLTKASSGTWSFRPGSQVEALAQYVTNLSRGHL